MAFYIKIQKTSENESVACYDFESDQGRRGVFEFNKQTGESSLIDPMPNDERLHCFNRAVVKVTREWKEGRLPQMVEWAS